MFRMTTAIFAALATSAMASSPFAPAQSANNGKAAMMSNLLRNAVPTKNSQIRRLDGNEEYQVDLSGYSLKFMKCQFVKAYDDELAEQEDIDTVLGTKRFVIFRLCPQGSCSACNYGYGEYLAPMDEYLEAVVEYRQEEQQEYCNTCQETCEAEQEEANNDGQEEEQQAEEGGERRLTKNKFSRKLTDDCDTCTDICEKIENMEENYYIDATEFLNCQQIYDGGDDDNKDANVLYAGPMCASSGQKIKIGVFTDDECMFLDDSKDVENYLADGDGVQMKLSHALLKTVYDDEDCISCLVPEEEDENQDGNNNNNQEEKEAEVQEVCQQLYEQAGKCEKVHGFDNGYADYDEYANQAANEEIVCDFISSIKSGTYSQTGEIQVGGGTRYAAGSGSTTGGQKFALTFFILGTVGLAVYSAMLHTNLTKNSKADLSAQGGAMA